MRTIAKLLAGFVGATLLFAASVPVRAASADAAAALRAAVAVERARAPAPRQSREAFLASPSLPVVQLSPDGRHVAYLRNEGESRSLWLLPTDGGAARQLVPRTQAGQLRWSRDGRWLFVFAQRSLSTLEIATGAGIRVPLLGPAERRVMQVDLSQPAAVILRERIRSGIAERWRIVRMDTRGHRTQLWEDAHWVHDVATDARGRLVALSRFMGDHDAIAAVEAKGRLRELRRMAPMESGMLLGVARDGGLLLAGDTGGNLRRVLRLDLDGTLRTLHADPTGEADLDEVVLDPSGSEPLVASYRSSVPSTYGLGPAQAGVAVLRARFPGRDIGIDVAGGPHPRWLVSERASTLRDARWHLYDPATGQLRTILADGALARRPLPEAALAHKIAFDYTASDGRRVHGFLLLPPGADPARAPLVANVHGGPINHFQPGYDAIAQLLANRGYAVFETNFRGSTGYGRDYTFAPHGDYGNGRVQQDITDGVRYLLAQGIGDPQRVGIVGHSFGGYSALLGVTFQPELFKVGVAGSPPPDLAWGMRWLVASGDQGALPDRSLALTLRALKMDPSDPATYARLHSQSPLANASRMRRPLLVMAGGADRTVAARGVIDYVARLKQLGKQASLYVEPGGGHSPVAPVPRAAYAYLMLAMLHAHLGGDAPEAPDAELRAYLRKNLRLAGSEFAALKKR
ncbi:prolyl oligopeptidase family serine peptidase [Cognatiluteimonas weifangensis]|uniref:S9 family peptidase n=1 Tax=Cognatiluteimonas weifangensis TaxID=2303539 RepID=A0A372DK18_9GAMM|nr:prolyl oligopeptidase family serine peptidase [Luteimonas weifangensis]RFP59928.1 S9 family peptidase [Luteimonas weifangensis]